MRDASIWAVMVRPHDREIHIEAVMTPDELAKDARAITLRHRFNADLRGGWLKGAPQWTAEDVFKAFDAVSPEARRRFYDKAVNLA